MLPHRAARTAWCSWTLRAATALSRLPWILWLEYIEDWENRWHFWMQTLWYLCSEGLKYLQLIFWALCLIEHYKKSDHWRQHGAMVRGTRTWNLYVPRVQVPFSATLVNSQLVCQQQQALLPKLKLNKIYNINILIQKEVIFTQNN